LALEANGDFTVLADAHAGLLTPDVGPPRTGGNRAEDRALFSQGLIASGVRRGAEFPVDFVPVDVGQQLVQQGIGTVQFEDLVSGQQWWQAFLPVIVAAFDFAFGLGRRGVAQIHAVEVERLTELGEGVGVVGVEEGVVVHIERQGHAVDLEDAGQEVEMGEERFLFVEARAGVVAGGVGERRSGRTCLSGQSGSQAWGLASYCQSAP